MSTKGPEAVEKRRSPDKATRRQEILQAARDVFAKHGYHAAKIDDIVAAAGVARGTFYLYFEDKRAIFEEIVDRTFSRASAWRSMRVDIGIRRRVAKIRANIRRIVHALLEDRRRRRSSSPTRSGSIPRSIGSSLLLRGGRQAPRDVARSTVRSAASSRRATRACRRSSTIGALKEVMYQVVVRGWDDSEEDIVEALFGFLRDGVLSM